MHNNKQQTSIENKSLTNLDKHYRQITDNIQHKKTKINIQHKSTNYKIRNDEIQRTSRSAAVGAYPHITGTIEALHVTLSTFTQLTLQEKFATG